jgi:agmatinase
LGHDEPLALIYLGAHADTIGKIYDAEINDDSLVRMAAAEGVIDPERTIQIGIRGSLGWMWEFSYDSGMRVVTVEEVQEKGI